MFPLCIYQQLCLLPEQLTLTMLTKTSKKKKENLQDDGPSAQ